MSDDHAGDADLADPNDRYLETLREQTELRGRGIEALRAGEFDPSVPPVRDAIAEHARRFDGDLLVLAAVDFGAPAALVPADLSDPPAALNRLLDELHRERGKWREDEALRPVRAAVREAEPAVHKVLPALVGDGVRYDLPGGSDPAANFLTIRQAVGLVDWVANSYQAGDLTVRY